MVHKDCKETFYKESFLISKEKEAATVASVSNNTDENTTMEGTTSIPSIRKSCRKLTQHKSSEDDRNCAICNEINQEQGRKQTFTSKMTPSTKMQRILLQQNVSILFIANVSYHKDCYQSVRSPCWEKSLQKSKSDKITHDVESTEFFKLIPHHIIEPH